MGRGRGVEREASHGLNQQKDFGSQVGDRARGLRSDKGEGLRCSSFAPVSRLRTCSCLRDYAGLVRLSLRQVVAVVFSALPLTNCLLGTGLPPSVPTSPHLVVTNLF